MWKYWITTDNVFWTDNTVDKPSENYLDSMNWELVDLAVDLINPNRIEFYSSRTDLSLIKIVNDENNQILYYRFNKILKYNKNNYLLEFVIDYWCMFSLKFIEKDINVLCDRHQDYNDDKCLEFNDELLNKLDLSFNDMKFYKNYFEQNNLDFINGEYKIKYKRQDDVINGCFCLVINDNDKNDFSAYTYIPILSRSLPVTITNSSKPYNEIFMNAYNRDYKDGVFGYGGNTFSATWNFYKQYDYVDKYLELKKIPNNVVTTKINIEFKDVQDTTHSVQFDISKEFNRVQKLDNVIVELSCRSTTFAPMVGITGDGQLVLDVYDTNGEFDRKLWTKIYNKIYTNKDYDFRKDTFKIDLVFGSTKSLNFEDRSVNNSITKINNLIKGSLIKRINGVYIIPNVLNLAKCWKIETIENDDVLTLDIPQHGVKINDLILVKDLVQSNNLIFNSSSFIFKSILKHFNINWLNNNLNASQLLSDEKIILNGVINFTNTFNFINENNFNSINSNLITFPSQQPLKIDKYNEYVQSNMNSVNTGYEISKQQNIISGIKGGLGSLMGGVFGSLLTGNFLGLLGGVGGVVNSAVGSSLNVQNYEKQVRAKYADLENQLGNQLIFSATNDILWNNELTNEYKHFDLIQLTNLSNDSIIQLNNTLLLNGVYNPKYFKLNALPQSTKHLGFVYAKLNSTNFNQIFSKYINEPLNVKEQILAQLCEFRMWDKIPSIE